MKPTNKNLAKYSGKSEATIARWKVNNKHLYTMIKKDFMLKNRQNINAIL